MRDRPKSWALPTIVFPAALFLASACASTGQLDRLEAENAALRAKLSERQREKSPRIVPTSGDDAAARRGERKPAGIIDWKQFPVGSMWIDWGHTAKLGWADLRVRAVRDCERDIAGVELEIRNRSDRQLSGYELETHATVKKASGEPLPRTATYERCRNESMVVAAGTIERIWLPVEGALADLAHLELELRHPHGLAEHRLIFGLKKGLEAPVLSGAGRTLDKRPPAPQKRVGEPVETPYFRTTVMSTKLCMPQAIDGKLSFGVEVLFENFSNVTLEMRESATLKDADGYEHKNNTVGYVGDCEPRLEHARVEPGQRARGWLFPFMMKPGAADLTLHHNVTAGGFMSSGYAPIEIAIGSVPEPSPALQAPKKWIKPKPTAVSGSDYTVTVTDLKPCSEVIENGKMWLGVEIRIDNRGSTDLAIPGYFKIHDAEGYVYALQRYDFGDASPCAPNLSGGFVKPGQKVRGWVGGFRVPSTIGTARLQHTLAWEPKTPSQTLPKESVVEIPIGHLE